VNLRRKVPSVEASQHGVAEHGLGRSRPQGVAVIDGVTPGQRRVDERHRLMPTLAWPAASPSSTSGLATGFRFGHEHDAPPLAPHFEARAQSKTSWWCGLSLTPTRLTGAAAQRARARRRIRVRIPGGSFRLTVIASFDILGRRAGVLWVLTGHLGQRRRSAAKIMELANTPWSNAVAPFARTE